MGNKRTWAGLPFRKILGGIIFADALLQAFFDEHVFPLLWKVVAQMPDLLPQLPQNVSIWNALLFVLGLGLLFGDSRPIQRLRERIHLPVLGRTPQAIPEVEEQSIAWIRPTVEHQRTLLKQGQAPFLFKVGQWLNPSHLTDPIYPYVEFVYDYLNTSIFTFTVYDSTLGRVWLQYEGDQHELPDPIELRNPNDSQKISGVPNSGHLTITLRLRVTKDVAESIMQGMREPYGVYFNFSTVKLMVSVKEDKTIPPIRLDLDGSFK